jgi:hypothetical protein
MDDIDSKHLSNYKLLDFALVNVHITEDLVDQELLIQVIAKSYMVDEGDPGWTPCEHVYLEAEFKPEDMVSRATCDSTIETLTMPESGSRPTVLNGRTSDSSVLRKV